MKTSIVRIFMKSVAWLTLLISPTLVQAEKTITLANGEWAPYLSEKLKHHGYVTHIVTEAFAEEGIKVNYVFLPWKRGFEDAKAGKYQGTLVWGFNEERAKDFLYTDKVASLGTGVFQNKSKPIVWNEMKDLGKYKIGGVIGYAYGTEAFEKSGIIKINRIGKDVNNYKKLAAGRLDVVLEDTEVGHGLITKLGFQDKIELNAKTFELRDYSVLISKKAPNRNELLEAFNRGLKKVIEDGRYEKYLQASRRGEYKK